MTAAAAVAAPHPLRVLLASSASADPGASRVARALAELGCEVVYGGAGQTPAMIAVTALQESVDAVGASAPAAAVVAELHARGAADIAVFGDAEGDAIVAWARAAARPQVA